MAEKIIEHVYHLKGGEQAAVEYDNPLLDRREPIIVFCNDGTTRMKIGDGKNRYKDLPYVGGTIIYNNGDNNNNGDSSGDGNNDTVPGLQIIIDDSLSYVSTNPVQNRIITQALDGKVSIEAGKGLSSNDFKDEFKLKLENIEYGANKTIVDNKELDANSNNAVSNAVVANALDDTKEYFEDKISATGQLIDTLDSELGTLSGEVDLKVAQINSDIAGVNSNLNTKINDEIATVNSTINSSIEEVNSSIDDVRESIESEVEALNNTIDQKAQELNGSILSLNGDITNLDTKMNTLDSEVDAALTNMNSSIDDKVTNAVATQLPTYIQQMNLDGGRI